MSQIQVTDEISTKLTRLRSAVNTTTNFNRAQKIVFENSRDYAVLTSYQTVIQNIGRLGEQYREIFTRDITACEKTVENMRELDREAGKAMIRAI